MSTTCTLEIAKLARAGYYYSELGTDAKDSMSHDILLLLNMAQYLVTRVSTMTPLLYNARIVHTSYNSTMEGLYPAEVKRCDMLKFITNGCVVTSHSIPRCNIIEGSRIVAIDYKPTNPISLVNHIQMSTDIADSTATVKLIFHHSHHQRHRTMFSMQILGPRSTAKWAIDTRFAMACMPALTPEDQKSMTDYRADTRLEAALTRDMYLNKIHERRMTHADGTPRRTPPARTIFPLNFPLAENNSTVQEIPISDVQEIAELFTTTRLHNIENVYAFLKNQGYTDVEIALAILKCNPTSSSPNHCLTSKVLRTETPTPLTDPGTRENIAIALLNKLPLPSFPHPT